MDFLRHGREKSSWLLTVAFPSMAMSFPLCVDNLLLGADTWEQAPGYKEPKCLSSHPRTFMSKALCATPNAI